MRTVGSKEDGLWDPTSIEEENKVFGCRNLSLVPSRYVLKPWNWRRYMTGQSLGDVHRIEFAKFTAEKVRRPASLPHCTETMHLVLNISLLSKFKEQESVSEPPKPIIFQSPMILGSLYSYPQMVTFHSASSPTQENYCLFADQVVSKCRN